MTEMIVTDVATMKLLRMFSRKPLSSNRMR